MNKFVTEYHNQLTDTKTNLFFIKTLIGDKGVEVKGIVDTGATGTIISVAVVKKIGLWHTIMEIPLERSF